MSVSFQSSKKKKDFKHAFIKRIKQLVCFLFQFELGYVKKEFLGLFYIQTKDHKHVTYHLTNTNTICITYKLLKTV